MIIRRRTDHVDYNTPYRLLDHWKRMVWMAFADTLLSETDASMTVVDRFHKPGGHWNVAYPFVTLHQPSAFYDVSSRELSTVKKWDGAKQGTE